MAVLQILHLPDLRLRQKTQPVTDFGAQLQSLIEDMFETMYDAPGVGLAANQVGVFKRLAVMDCADKDAEPRPMVIINPEILERTDEQAMEEGCLSVPGYLDTIKRHNRLRMKAQDRHGKHFEIEAEGLMAQAIQHEIDHLDGKLFVDYLSSLKRERLKKKLLKQAKEK